MLFIVMIGMYWVFIFMVLVVLVNFGGYEILLLVVMFLFNLV